MKKIVIMVLMMMVFNQLPAQNKLDNLTLTVYPNPANHILNVQVNTNKLYTLVISNILGTSMYEQDVDPAFNEKTALDLRSIGIPSGIYLIKIIQEKEIVGTKKLVVRQ